MSNYRHIEVKRNGAVHVLHFRDHKILNDMVIEKVGEEMFSVAADEECKNLLLNFSEVGFLSSSVLGKLITLNKRMRAKGGQLKLCELQPDIRELFTLTSLDKIFDIKPDETSGLLGFY